jgi:hypothetical protein
LVLLLECHFLLLPVVDEVTLIGILRRPTLILVVIVNSDLRIVVRVILLSVVPAKAALLLVGLRLLGSFRLGEAVDTRLVLGGLTLLEVLVGALLRGCGLVDRELGGAQADVHLAC